MTPREQAVQRMNRLLDNERISSAVKREVVSLQGKIDNRVRAIGQPMTARRAVTLMTQVKGDINATFKRLIAYANAGIIHMVGSKALPQLGKAPMETWLTAQANALSERFNQELRMSMLNNENLEQLLERIHGKP